MTTSLNTLDDFIQMMRRKAPEYLDLLTAESDSEFEAAFDVMLEKAIVRLETNKRNFQNLDEEGLSGVLAAALSMPGLSVTQETNSNGHVDLTIEADHCVPLRKKLGEAKIYDGAVYHFGGIAQLLGRYTTGREGRGLLIVYFRKRDVAGLVKDLRKKMGQRFTIFPTRCYGRPHDEVVFHFDPCSFLWRQCSTLPCRMQPVRRVTRPTSQTVSCRSAPRCVERQSGGRGDSPEADRVRYACGRSVSCW